LSEEYLFILLFLVFWLATYILSKILPLKKYGLEVKPLFLRYESNIFKRFIYKCSSRWRALWRTLSILSVFLGFMLMFFAMAFLSWNLFEALSLSGGKTAVMPVIPGLTLRLYWLPYFTIAVVATLLIHEAAHGILALTEGVSIKSAGAMALAIFIGGFVEVDEDDLNKMPAPSRMKIFSAGSSSNILSGLIVFLMLSAVFVQSPSGIVVLEVSNGGPLDKAGIGRWDVIHALNGTLMRSDRDLVEFMSNVKPGDRIVVSTSRGNFTITVSRNPLDPDRAIIGIMYPYMLYYPSRLGLGCFWDIQVYLVLNWLLLVLVNLAVLNMLPIPLFDGDRFLQCLLELLSSRSSYLKKFFNIFSIFLIVANITVGLRL